MRSIEGGGGKGERRRASGGWGWATLPTAERLCTRLKGFSLDFISHPITWYTHARTHMQRERERKREKRRRRKENERERERGSKGHRGVTRARPRCKNTLNVAAAHIPSSLHGLTYVRDMAGR